MTEFMITIWQPIMIRFGPVEADSHDDAMMADLEDYGVSVDDINRALARVMPEGCWAEWSDDLAEATLVFAVDDENNDVFYDRDGKRENFTIRERQGRE